MPTPLFRDSYGLTGQDALVETFENEFLLDGYYHREDAAAILDGDSLDYGNTGNTGLLRKGLLMSLDRATNQWKPWLPFVPNTVAAINYAQTVDGILSKTIDLTGNTSDRQCPILRIGRVRADRLAISHATEGVALGLTGNDYRYLVGRQMAPNIMMDNLDYVAQKPIVYVTGLDSDPAMDAANYPNGTRFLFAGGSTAPFTLPAPLPGLEYHFTTLGDSDIVITSAGANQIYMNNDIVNTLTASDEGASLSILGVELSAGTHVWAAIANTPVSDTEASWAGSDV